jgi:hypothetical protein
MADTLLTVRDGETEVDASPNSSVGSLISSLPVPVNERAC